MYHDYNISGSYHSNSNIIEYTLSDNDSPISDISNYNLYIEDPDPASFYEDLNNSPYIVKCHDEKEYIETKKEDKVLPFKESKKLDNILSNFGLVSINMKTNNINRKKYYRKKYKFKVIKYGKGEKKKSRKECPSFNKKINNQFFRALIKVINKKIKKAGYNRKFEYFPKSFITTPRINSKVLKLTFEELIENIEKFEIKYTKKEEEKNTKNKEVLNDLRDNPEICKNSKFNFISCMKYIDIFKAYFLSKEFEKSVIKLSNRQTKKYMEKYVNIALTFVQFYSDTKYIDKKVSSDKEEDESSVFQL